MASLGEGWCREDSICLPQKPSHGTSDFFILNVIILLIVSHIKWQRSCSQSSCFPSSPPSEHPALRAACWAAFSRSHQNKNTLLLQSHQCQPFMRLRPRTCSESFPSHDPPHFSQCSDAPSAMGFWSSVGEAVSHLGVGVNKASELSPDGREKNDE